VDSSADVAPFPNERLFHFSSGQHYVGRFPPAPEDRLEGSRAYRGNPLDFLVTLRSLLVALVEWVRDDVAPPDSVHPTIRTGTLVPIDEVRFPQIPGVEFPRVVHEAYRADYGPRWDDGIVDTQPPRLGRPFRSLVSQVDELGNEGAGARALEVLAPLGTYAPWNLRTGVPGGERELRNFVGTYIPLPRTEEERQRHRDPRPSIESLYPTRQHYRAAAALAAADLVEKRLLLPEDVLRVLERAEANWDWIHLRPKR
jgi:hypothetical protein